MSSLVCAYLKNHLLNLVLPDLSLQLALASPFGIFSYQDAHTSTILIQVIRDALFQVSLETDLHYYLAKFSSTRTNLSFLFSWTWG
jgi:hypothetical protein